MPGEGVTPDEARAVGCEYAEVMRLAEQYERELGDGDYYTPHVGWGACRVLAAIGMPDRAPVPNRDRGPRIMVWEYDDGADLRIVGFAWSTERGVWVVERVAW